MINVVMVNLGEAEDNQLGFLNELFARRGNAEEKYRNLEKKYGIILCDETKGVVENMCNLGEEIYQEGMQQGRKEGIVELIERVMKLKNYSYVQATDYLQLSENEREQYQMYFM